MSRQDLRNRRPGFRCTPPAPLPRAKINALRIVVRGAIVAAILAAVRIYFMQH